VTPRPLFYLIANKASSRGDQIHNKVANHITMSNSNGPHKDDGVKGKDKGDVEITASHQALNVVGN
jgi:hypothetical protein